jgi:hypothetical protein
VATPSGEISRNVPHVRTRITTSLLEYALTCDFPLLLAVADLSQRQVFVSGLRDYVEHTLQTVMPDWRDRRSVTLYIPEDSSVEEDVRQGAVTLRSYALDLARQSALGMLTRRIRTLEKNESARYLLSGDLDAANRPVRVMLRLEAFRNAIRQALAFDVLFGDRGVPQLKALRPLLEDGLKRCEQIQIAISSGTVRRYTVEEVTPIMFAEVWLSSIVESYRELCAERLYIPSVPSSPDPLRGFDKLMNWIDHGLLEEWASGTPPSRPLHGSL